MKYDEYVSKVKDMCIMIDQDTGFAVVLPAWLHILRKSNMIGVELQDDIVISTEQLNDILDKQVKTYNTLVDRTQPVLRFLNIVIDDILNTTQAKEE